MLGIARKWKHETSCWGDKVLVSWLRHSESANLHTENKGKCCLGNVD
jgi:hypothetical protein